MKSEEALEQIEYLKELTEKTRMNAAYGYHFFILWGILCIIGYLHRLIFPIHLWGWIWLIITIVGMILTAIFIINRNKKYGYTQLSKKIGLQCLVLFAVDELIFCLLLYYKIYALLNPYWAFQIGVVHIIAGVHIGRDFRLIGLWMTIAAIASFYMPAQLQHIWLAISFGGGMLFTGILFKYQVKKAENTIVE
jgi:hypothetical protein